MPSPRQYHTDLDTLLAVIVAPSHKSKPKPLAKQKAPPLEEPIPTFRRLVEVAVDAPLYGTFTYIADDFTDELVPGVRVLVPFGRRPLPGFILGEKNPATLAQDGVDPRRLKPILKVFTHTSSALTPSLLQLARWMAHHYVCPLGQVLAAMLPAGVKRQMQAARQRFIEPLKTSDELLQSAQLLEKKKPRHAALLYLIAMHFRRRAARTSVSGTDIPT